MNLRASLPPDDSVYRRLAQNMPHRVESSAEIADITARLRS